MKKFFALTVLVLFAATALADLPPPGGGSPRPRENDPRFPKLPPALPEPASPAPIPPGPLPPGPIPPVGAPQSEQPIPGPLPPGPIPPEGASSGLPSVQIPLAPDSGSATSATQATSVSQEQSAKANDDPNWKMYGAGIFGTLGLVALGVWASRRKAVRGATSS